MNAKNVNADAAQRFHGAWRLIEDEHQALAAVLHALRFLLDEIGAGRIEPDFRLLRAMLYYLTEYPERRHHPNEDRYLFARLKEKTSEADAVIARLEKEHAAAEQRIAELEAALHAFTSREPGGFDRFRDVFDRYAHFYRQHMMTEEREVLPIAERHFTPEDWDRFGCRTLSGRGTRSAILRKGTRRARPTSSQPQRQLAQHGRGGAPDEIVAPRRSPVVTRLAVIDETQAQIAVGVCEMGKWREKNLRHFERIGCERSQRIAPRDQGRHPVTGYGHIVWKRT